MSGHSKWSTIKRKKGAADAKRGKVFGKLIREITVAARMGGEDPESNPRLRAAIASARSENMPQDNINRAIAKASAAAGGEDYAEVTYEGYGPGGAAILLDALTDNKNRTASEVRHAFSKYGGNLGSSNCVAWMFERKGYVAINKETINEDKIMEVILDAGADDLRDADEYWEVICDTEAFDDVIKALDKAGIKTEEAKIAKISSNTTTISEKDSDKLMILLEMLEDLDDVQNVWTNFDVEE